MIDGFPWQLGSESGCLPQDPICWQKNGTDSSILLQMSRFLAELDYLVQAAGQDGAVWNFFQLISEKRTKTC